ncbi:sugar 3,4-ketoisomerase [Chryseobacterium sp. SIMBA_038]|uniref:sugar 3,4-ketoisomerase n=2 Tax=Bacteria TaxID=2 RepID=UPI00397C8BD0
MEARLINLPKILDKRGNLSFFEHPNQIPFEIKRTYWIYDVPGGEMRGSHAFKEQQEFIIALSGSFDVVIHNGDKEQRFSLNRSYYGLYIPKMYWRRLENFSTNSLALIVSDKSYNEHDYIRDFEEFKKLLNEK